ncbi:MAG: potassium-transporting ATPase subunit KdpC [Sphingomonadales bacterium]|nr:potassium-transporting ATPase subunit KdpC [Sphingomonadales bacterium]
MLQDLTAALRPAVVLTLLFAVLLGLVYPAAVTVIGQGLFPAAANGSLLTAHGRLIGSSLIGQPFTGPEWFHPRPSAAGKGYDATASSGSNLGPASQALADRVKGDLAALRTSPGRPVPPDLVTTSASGLDPHISPEAAFFQAPRVAAARRLPVSTVRELVAAHLEGPWLGLLGEPRVNVLELNLALDRASAGGSARHP